MANRQGARSSSVCFIQPAGATAAGDESARALAKREFARMSRELDTASTPGATERPPTISILLPPSGPPPQSVRFAEIPRDRHRWSQALEAEIEGLYVLHGEAGLSALGRNLTYAKSAKLGSPYIPPHPNPLPDGSYDALKKAIDDAEAAFRERVSRLTSEVQKVAVDLALQRLSAAQTQIDEAAMRYLDMPSRDWEAARRRLDADLPASRVLLKGPGVISLMAALMEIGRLQQQLDQSASASSPVAPLLTYDYLAPAEPVDRRQEIIEALSLTVSACCEEHPVLYRIWNRTRLTDGVRPDPNDRGGQAVVATSRAAGAALAEIRTAIYDVLSAAYEGNAAFRAKLASEPEQVWEFPALIEAALEQQTDEQGETLSIAADGVTRAVAHNRLARQGGMSDISIAQIIVGGGEIAATIVATPAVVAFLALASLILGIYDTIQDYLRRRLQNQAAASVLDPTHSPAEPTGYAGVALNIAFSMLDLKGFRDAFRAARYADEMSAASRAADVVAPP